MGEKFIPDVADPRFGGKDLAAAPHRPEQADPHAHFRNLDLVQGPFAAAAKADMLIGGSLLDPWGEYLISPRAPHPATLVDFGPSAVDLPMAEARKRLQSLRFVNLGVGEVEPKPDPSTLVHEETPIPELNHLQVQAKDLKRHQEKPVSELIHLQVQVKDLKNVEE